MKNSVLRDSFGLSRALSIVLILGPVNMDDLHKLSGLGGLGMLGDIASSESHGKSKAKEKFDKDKEKDKVIESGTQMICKDNAAGAIHSWVFSSDGGFVLL